MLEIEVPNDCAAVPILGTRDERLLRLKRAWISSLFIRPLSLLTPLVTIPLFLNYLGVERYGMMESVGALAAWLSVTNLGLTLGLQNRLVLLAVKNDKEAAKQCVSTIFFFLFAGMLVMMLLLTFVTPFIDLTRIFSLKNPISQREAPWAFWLAGIATLATLITSLPSSVYFGYQELHRNNVWEGITRVVTFLCCVAVTHTSWGVIGALSAISIAPIVVRMINMAFIFAVDKPFLMPALSHYSNSLLRPLLWQGAIIFLLQFACNMLYQMDKVLIGVLLGSDEVVGYAILGKLYLTVYAVFMTFLHPLWATYGEALGRGDTEWVKKIVRKSTLVGCGLMTAAGVVLLFTADWIVGRLPEHSTDGITISKSLILAFLVTYALRAFVDSRSVVLLAANILKPQLFYYCGHCVLNLVMAIPAAQWWGVEGVAWCTPVSGLFTSVVGYHLLMRRHIVAPHRPINVVQVEVTAQSASSQERF